MNISKLLFGRPLSSQSLEEQRLPKFKALPVFSSDALSSVAYATEEILRVLMLGGITALSFALPIAVVICALITILVMSYWQTIYAYPNGGGAFTVTQENLGKKAGLMAAAALLIDYILTVAVSVTAGVRAMVSAFPVLYPHTVLLSLLTILVITVINLRGVQESATAFAFPTYVFTVLIMLLVGMGIFHHFHSSILMSPIAVVASAQTQIQTQTQAISLILLLRAFSAGCTAMTGIECVANGVPVFEKPEARNAAQTLLILALLLITLFLGITYLAHDYALSPQETESILSQLAKQIFGHHFLYYALQLSTALILLLAANTAFAGFPRLASILAAQKYLPKQFTSLGDRLSFSNGIIFLAVLSGLLIIAFHGVTHALIPLYAVGVFTAFSLSQLGMVRHWCKIKTRYWLLKATINGVGFLSTTLALLVIIESKFLAGAWLVLVCVPVLLTIFHQIYCHYMIVNRELTMTTEQANACLQKLSGIRPKVILPVSRIHHGTLAALNFATSISDDVTAVMVLLENDQTLCELKSSWGALNTVVPLIVLTSPYRSALDPLKKFIREQDLRDPQKGLCMLVFPQAIPSHWWQDMLHNQRSFLLKTSLMLSRKHKGGTRIFVDVPYQLRR